MTNDSPEPVRWNPSLYDSMHSFVWQRGADLLALLAPQPGERILDAGCGTGHLTAQLAAAGARVTGIDSSSAMIREAQRNYPELEFLLADARDLHFEEAFDAVFSNAALHWVRQPERVAESIHRALQPGGRFVAELGGKGNIAKFVAALLRARADIGFPLSSDALPWYYPSIGEYASVLETHGLEVTFTVLFDRLTALEGGEAGLENWIHMFGASFTGSLPAEKQTELIRRLESLLRGELFREGVWHLDYRRLRIIAWKRL